MPAVENRKSAKQGSYELSKYTAALYCTLRLVALALVGLLTRKATNKNPTISVSRADYSEENRLFPIVYVCPSKKPDYNRNPTITESTIARDNCIPITGSS
jgi:hypothetical protein